MKCPICNETHIPEDHLYGFPIVACPQVARGRLIFIEDNRVEGVLINVDDRPHDDDAPSTAGDVRA